MIYSCTKCVIITVILGLSGKKRLHTEQSASCWLGLNLIRAVPFIKRFVSSLHPRPGHLDIIEINVL